MIPKIFHRIWLGENLIPERYDWFWEKWKILHPEWKFIEWDNENIKALSLYSLIQDVKSNAAKADIARYEIVYRHGGVYLDCDMDCKRPIDDLITNSDFIVCNEAEDFNCFCSIGFFASSKNHRILKKAIDNLLETSAQKINLSQANEITGPYFFRRIINNSDVKLLKTQCFYPYFHSKGEYYLHESTSIYGIHVWEGSWFSLDQMLQKAKLKVKHGDLKGGLDTVRAINERKNEVSGRLKWFTQKIWLEMTLMKYLYYLFFRILIDLISVLMTQKLVNSISFDERLLTGVLSPGSEESEKTSWTKKIRQHLNLKKNSKKIAKKVFSINLSSLQYDHLLEDFFEKEEIKRVIEVGAMDGKSFDVLFPYLKCSSNTIALLIEPLKDHFEDLIKNYGDKNTRGNKLYFENVAITPETGNFTITRIPRSIVQSNNLPDWTKGISSLAPEKNTIHKCKDSFSNQKLLKNMSIEENIKGVRLNTLVEKYNLQDADVLQIDTEGFDYIVLMQALSITSPKIICFEWVNLLPNEKKDALEILRKKDYIFFLNSSKSDIIACKRKFYHALNCKVFSSYRTLLVPY